MNPGRVFEPIARDVRVSVRLLRKSPSFTIAAIVTLAMAIAANAVVFSVLNGLVLRPLNLPREESLFAVERTVDRASSESYPNFLDLRDRNRSFESLTAFAADQVWLSTGDTPLRVWGLEVSGNYFDALEIRPKLGRLLHAADDRGTNSAPYVVLSYAYWNTHFQGDSGIVGRVVRINTHPYTVIGVAPEGFRGTVTIFSPDVFLPLVDQPQLDGNDMLTKRGERWLTVVGHLRAGITPTQAVADLDPIGASLVQSYPKDLDKLHFALGRTALGDDSLATPIKAFLTGLTVLAALILIAACTNLGNLFAARASARSRELALQLALGATRGRVVQQLLTEALLLGLVGGGVGLWASVMLLDRVSTWHPFPQFPLNMPVTADTHVYAMAVLLSIASGLLFGAVPVGQVLRTNPYQVVKAGPMGRSRRRMTTRDALLIVQIAACALLVTSSMVALRGLMRSLHADFGFDPRNVTLVETDLAMAGYRPADVAPMQRVLIDAMRTIPGVSSVGLIGQAPPMHFVSNASKVFEDDTPDFKPSSAVAEATMYSISPEYLDAARTRLLSGRQFTIHDDAAAPRVAIINQVFARRMFGSSGNPVGRFYKLPDGTRLQVVGLIPDGKNSLNLADATQPAMFFPILRSPSPDAWLVIRSQRDLAQLSTAIRAEIHNADPGLPSFIETWNTALRSVLFAPEMASLTLGVLGAMGAILSITGIFGMAAYSLTKRVKELGIRMALGAQRDEVLSAALGRPFRVLILGSVAGFVLGVLASRILASIVYQATPRDPLVLAGVVLAMLVVGLTATWIPARRALAVDPSMLLRQE